MVLGAGWGIGQGTFGVFVNPITEETGWSRAAISTMYSISMLVAFSFGAFWGWLSDRWSVKGVLALSGGLTGLGIFLSSTAQSLWQLYLLYGLIAGAGLGGTTGTLTGLATRWFDRRRGLAIGIGFAGSAAGGAGIPILADRLISLEDWRFGFMVLSFIIWGAFFVGVVLLKEPRRRPPDGAATAVTSRRASDGVPSIPLSAALRTRQFWLLLGMIVAPELILTMMLVHLVPAAIDAGISSATAATLLTVFGMTKLVGMLGGGALGDRLGHRRVYIVAMLVQMLSLLWLTAGVRLWMFYVFAVAYGLGNGAWSPQFPAIAARMFGIRHIGAIVGAVLIGAGLGGLIGPVTAGYIFDTTDSYRLAFIVGSGVCILGVATALLMRRAPLRSQDASRTSPPLSAVERPAEE